MKFRNAHFIEYTPDRWLTTDDIILMPQYSNIESRNSPKVSTTTELFPGINLTVPFLSASMDTVTGPEMAIAMHGCGGMGVLHRFFESEDARIQAIEQIHEAVGYVAFSIGTKLEELKFVTRLINDWDFEISNLVVNVDIAHGESKNCVDTVATLSRNIPGLKIIAGSVATPLGAQRLIQAGASALRVGIGPGSMCTTRIVTGHGVPQLSAILNIHRTVYGMQSNVKIIADGGIRNSGDIVKLIAAGADAVMIGRLFAGTDESAGGNFYRGQSSLSTLQSLGRNDVAPEGESMEVPRLGPVRDVVENLRMGLRSGMTYTGAHNLTELCNKAVALEHTYNGLVEARPHGKS